MYDIILRLQRVIFNTDKKEKSVFNYKKNKMKESPYICFHTKRQINRLYTTSDFLYEFGSDIDNNGNGNCDKALIAFSLLQDIMKSFVKFCIEHIDLNNNSQFNIYHHNEEDILRLIENNLLTIFIEEIAKYLILCIHGTGLEAHKTFNTMQVIQNELSCHIKSVGNANWFASAFKLYVKDEDMQDSPYHYNLIDYIIKCIFIRGYTGE